MLQVEKIQKEIERLPQKDFVRLRQWFAEKDWQRWDHQFESDVETGKLDFLLVEASTAKTNHTLDEL